MSFDSHLDLNVKANLLADLLNLAAFPNLNHQN